MKTFFSDPVYKNRARLLAILWTLLILFLCFIPAREIPDVEIPLIDKWTHCFLFGIFAFLWLFSIKNFKNKYLFLVLLSAVILGWLVEYMQGLLSFLGRSQDNMDTLSDSIGGLLGVIIFFAIHSRHKNYK